MFDKGHEAENLQKDSLFLLHYHFPMEDSSESLENLYTPQKMFLAISIFVRKKKTLASKFDRKHYLSVHFY